MNLFVCCCWLLLGVLVFERNYVCTCGVAFWFWFEEVLSAIMFRLCCCSCFVFVLFIVLVVRNSVTTKCFHLLSA